MHLKMVANNHGHLAPLACGDVAARGIELELDRKTSMANFRGDPAFGAGETSFSQYLVRLSQGDRSLVGLPVFMMRGYRHRCFYTLKNSGLNGFMDLEGRRVGTNGWPDTGNTWSRAALREQGIQIDKIHWWVGPLGIAYYDNFSRYPAQGLPAGVNNTPPGRTITDMLLDQELDALMCPVPPLPLNESGGRIARLFPDYRQVEQAYARRVGYFPAHHIVAIKREVFDRAPWAARSLFDALEQSKQLAVESRKSLADTTPWLQADLEETMQILGDDWQPNGVAPNRRMIQALCDEEYEQGLITRPLDGAAVFAEYEQAPLS